MVYVKYTKSMYGNYFIVEKNNEIIEILFPHVEMVKCEKSKIWGLNQRKCALYEKGSHAFLKSVFADKDKINIKAKALEMYLD